MVLRHLLSMLATEFTYLRDLCLAAIVKNNTPVGQGEVGEEMMRDNNPPHREIGDRRVDMRNEMQPPRPEP